MASLRNLAIVILRAYGHRNIAAACAATPATTAALLAAQPSRPTLRHFAEPQREYPGGLRKVRY